jgi:hypothetical protein
MDIPDFSSDTAITPNGESAGLDNVVFLQEELGHVANMDMAGPSVATAASTIPHYIVGVLSDIDTNVRTEHGGYKTTAISKGRIGDANRGKPVWNKGKPRSLGDKSKIKAGVERRQTE